MPVRAVWRCLQWKQLLNHLDETLNVFGQYAAQVERFAAIGEATDLDPLKISWRTVYGPSNVAAWYNLALNAAILLAARKEVG